MIFHVIRRERETKRGTKRERESFKMDVVFLGAYCSLTFIDVYNFHATKVLILNMDYRRL